MSARPRSDEKAQVILDAARTCLGERGYLATTIAEVAVEAGVSRGLLHYYFKSKEELLAQVVRDGCEATLELVAAMFAVSETIDDLAAGLANGLRAVLEMDPIYFNLVFECWAVARQSPLVAQELDDIFRQFREAMRDGLAQAVARDVITPAIPLDKLAALLLAVIDGLGLQLVTHPEMVDDEVTWEALEMAVHSLLK
ncbi:MAG: TetR/AcrR family transcriptional regulator [Anaerolineales bacterium]|nr:TetR/AcrR family transcriptional regulator [Chloroflexota bacterium]MBL7163003.1 TetR/AcrR family transcriptional regulator [Anaerolineales bacterium]